MYAEKLCLSKPMHPVNLRPCPTFQAPVTDFRGYIFQKLAWNYSCINNNCFFVKQTDTFGHIVIWTIYTSHIDHFTSLQTAFEHLAACLSVVLKLLFGLILFATLWHAGWTLDKNHGMNMNYSYLTAVFRPKYYVFLVFFTFFSIWTWKIHKQKLKKIYFSTRNVYI